MANRLRQGRRRLRLRKTMRASALLCRRQPNRFYSHLKRLAGAIAFAPPLHARPMVRILRPKFRMRGPSEAIESARLGTRDQNVGGCGSTSPPGGANWPGKYAGRCSDAGNCDFLEAGSDMERVIGAPPASVG